MLLDLYSSDSNEICMLRQLDSQDNPDVLELS